MHFTRNIQYVVGLALLSSGVRSISSTSCYYPDGTFAPFDSPCYPGQEQSICCGQGHTCMSNNLCRWPSPMPTYYAYIRGSCTDSSWNSTECGGTCKAVFPSSYNAIVSCPDAQFCCLLEADPRSCCTTASNLFTLQAASTVTVIGVTTSTPNSALSSTTSIQSALGSATSNLGGSANSQSIPTTASGPASSQSSSTTSATAGNNSGGDGGDNNSKRNIGIGVGVGVGAGAILLAALMFLLRRRRRNQAHVVEHAGTEVHPRWELGNNEVRAVGNSGFVADPNKNWHTVTPYTELEGNNVRGELRG